MLTQIQAMPRRVLPLRKSVFTKQVREATQQRLAIRYAKGKDTRHTLDGVDVYTYYDSVNKVRYFYSLAPNDLSLLYYSQVEQADSRGFFDSRFKIYYQSLVWTHPLLHRKHRGFARDVIYNIYPSYIDTVLITDRLQTDNGFYMWKHIVSEATDYGFTAIAYCYDKPHKARYICRLTHIDVDRYFDELDDLFGDFEYHENRGLKKKKKDIGQMMLRDIKVQNLPIADFLDAVASAS